VYLIRRDADACRQRAAACLIGGGIFRKIGRHAEQQNQRATKPSSRNISVTQRTAARHLSANRRGGVRAVLPSVAQA
jgi:hypothetical protein